MDVLWRRIAIGTIAGALASVSLLATVGRPFFSVAFGIVIGAMYSASLRPTRGAYVDNLMAAAALGVPFGPWSVSLRSRCFQARCQSGAPLRCGNISLRSSAGFSTAQRLA